MQHRGTHKIGQLQKLLLSRLHAYVQHVHALNELFFLQDLCLTRRYTVSCLC